MADQEYHDEPPHQAPWVFYVTVGAVAAFLAFFLLVKLVLTA